MRLTFSLLALSKVNTSIVQGFSDFKTLKYLAGSFMWGEYSVLLRQCMYVFHLLFRSPGVQYSGPYSKGRSRH